MIRSKNGFWLAIPTPSAPKRGIGGKRINPSNFPEHRFGPLRLVYRRRGPSLLVVDGVRANAGTGRMKAGMATVVMFILVPQVKMPKRPDVKRAAERWVGRLPRPVGTTSPSPASFCKRRNWDGIRERNDKAKGYSAPWLNPSIPTRAAGCADADGSRL